jgi:hypothetical protein
MRHSSKLFLSTVLVCLASLLTLSGCSDSGSASGSSANDVVASTTKAHYVVLAWNDLGMHCLNPSYDTAVILPPYNTVFAQVLKRGNPPQVVTSNLTVEYRIVNNTKSFTKGNFGQFWTNVLSLFGVPLASDTGLNLEDPTVNNGLSGTMLVKGDHFQANGIPVTPIDDSGVWNPYQVVEVTVKDGSGGVVAQTQATVPTSDEIHCDKCHPASAANNNNAFLDILQKHDKLHTPPDGLLVPSVPVLCARCHGAPELGTVGPGDAGIYLSAAIHKAHAARTAPDGSPVSCFDCHPGSITRCNRSIAHTASNGNCTTCHGSMRQVAYSIISSSRIPWVSEPKCASCHGGVAEVDTAGTLYRNAKGHGSVFCAGCHGSPHAMVPSREGKDNYQALQYQGGAKSISSCGVCHSGSRVSGSADFLSRHGNGSIPSACNVCHTGITSADSNKWPHQYQWYNR